MEANGSSYFRVSSAHLCFAKKCRSFVAVTLLFTGLAATSVEARSSYDATITRTTYGIPHINADDFGSLGYGVGYTAGEDSVCPIAEQLVTVRGERSRFFGEGTGGSDSDLQSDLFHRAVGNLGTLRDNFAKASRDYSALVGGFVAGYNRFLKDTGERLPEPCAGAEWVRPMSEDDVLLLLNAGAILHGLAQVVAPIVTAVPPDAQVDAQQDLSFLVEEDVGTFGSNGWAFGSEVTANGRGLLVGNPHFPWKGPNRFRQMHLTIPGQLDVMGAGLVYSPSPLVGFNKDVAWTHTISPARHHTLFELALDPNDPTVYLVDGKREPMTRRTVTIEIKGAQPLTHTLYASRYGPIVVAPRVGLGWTSQRAFAFRDANLFNLRGGDAWLNIARARSVHDVYEAVSQSLGIPYLHTIAADREGEALYADVSALPNVSAEKLARCGATAVDPRLTAAGIFVLDGSRTTCNWDVDRSTPVAGLMPAELMPTLLRRDFVQNSNDSYWLSNPTAPLPTVSPLIGLVETHQNLRTRSGIAEIGRRLAGMDGLPGSKVDQDAAKAMVFANKSMAAELILDDLLALCAGDVSLADACTALGGWDRRADLDSRGALLFFRFLQNVGLQNYMNETDWASIEDMWAVPFDPGDPVNTPRGLVRSGPAAEAIRKALAKADAELRAMGVPVSAPLGALQASPKGGQPIPIHGGPRAAGILNQIHSRLEGNLLVPYQGTSYVQVVSFSETGPVADAILAYSQSADPASPHYADQTRNFSVKRWHRLPFTQSEIVRERISGPLNLTE